MHHLLHIKEVLQLGSVGLKSVVSSIENYTVHLVVFRPQSGVDVPRPATEFVLKSVHLGTL